MLRKRALPAILLHAVIGPLAAQDPAPPLRLKSGRVPPSFFQVDAPEQRAEVRGALKRADAQRFHFILQFAVMPESADLDALGFRDVRALSYVPDNALLVSAGEGVDLSGLGVIYAARLEAEDKLSALLRNEESAVAVVELHADVDAAVGRMVALAEGLEVLDHPDLPPNAVMVRGPLAALEEAAQWDEVAYIYPASEELQRGEPLAPCGGGVVAPGELNGAANLAVSFGDGWDGPGLGSATLAYWFGKLPSGLAETEVKSEIVRALDAWSAVAQVKFAPASVPKLRREIEILSASRDHGDGYPFDGRGGVLAHTFYPPPNAETLAGDFHLDLDEPWRIGADVDIFSVALHELGHALGLGHNDDPNSVMYPYYRRLSGLRPADITEIRKLYAAAGASAPPPAQPPAQPPVQPPSQPPQTPPTAPGTDRTPPELAITSPSATTTTTTASSILIRGAATDNVAVTEVTWSSNAGWTGKASGLPSFTAGPIPLIVGINRITVTARDAAGNSSWRSVSVTRR